MKYSKYFDVSLSIFCSFGLNPLLSHKKKLLGMLVVVPLSLWFFRRRPWCSFDHRCRTIKCIACQCSWKISCLVACYISFNSLYWHNQVRFVVVWLLCWYRDCVCNGCCPIWLLCLLWWSASSWLVGGWLGTLLLLLHVPHFRCIFYCYIIADCRCCQACSPFEVACICSFN